MRKNIVISTIGVFSVSFVTCGAVSASTAAFGESNAGRHIEAVRSAFDVSDRSVRSEVRTRTAASSSSSSVSSSVSVSASTGGTTVVNGNSAASEGSTSSASISVKTIINGEVVEDHHETATDETGQGVEISHRSHHSADTDTLQDTASEARASASASASVSSSGIFESIPSAEDNATQNTGSHKKETSRSTDRTDPHIIPSHDADPDESENTQEILSVRQEDSAQEHPLLLKIWHYVLSLFRI